MAQAAPVGTPPNYRIPRLFGILNIVFASVLMCYGLCMSASIVMMPTMAKAMDQVQKEVEKKTAEQKKSALEAVAEEEKNAKTDEEKESVAARRKEIEARPKVDLTGMADITKFTSDPRIIGFYMLETFSGLFVNGLMLAAGIGLLKFRSWARTLSVQTATLKIVRLLLVYGFFVIAIVPPLSEKIGQFAGQMMTQQQKAMGGGGAAMPSTDVLIKIYTITYSMMGVGMIVVGSIYPALTMWFLSRPAVKAACAPRSKPQPESTDTW